MNDWTCSQDIESRADAINRVRAASIRAQILLSAASPDRLALRAAFAEHLIQNERALRGAAGKDDSGFGRLE